MTEMRLDGRGAVGTGQLDPTAEGRRVEPQAPLELEVVRDLDAVLGLRDRWQGLAEAAATTPFEHPAWLLPWFETYGRPDAPLVLAWRRKGELVGLVPLLAVARRRPLARSELLVWGGRGPLLRGSVDLLARTEDRRDVVDAFAAWLARGDPSWGLFHLLRLPPGSPTEPALRALAAREGWHLVDLTGVVRSTTYVIDLPADLEGWQRYLGPKARHNMRREVRLFARRRAGRYERWTDPAATDEVVDALRRFMGERWGTAEGYFRVDPRFDGFLRRALRAMLAAGVAYVDVALEPSGPVGLLVTFVVGRSAAAVLIGLRADPELGPLSIGKNLFDASIGEAVARGAASYDFLWVGGYKETFWHATPRRTASLVLGRGWVGRLASRAIELRRVVGPRLLGRGRGDGPPNRAASAGSAFLAEPEPTPPAPVRSPGATDHGRP